MDDQQVGPLFHGLDHGCARVYRHGEAFDPAAAFHLQPVQGVRIIRDA